jgi:hypothetical protein
MQPCDKPNSLNRDWRTDWVKLHVAVEVELLRGLHETERWPATRVSMVSAILRTDAAYRAGYAFALEMA